MSRSGLSVEVLPPIKSTPSGEAGEDAVLSEEAEDVKVSSEESIPEGKTDSRRHLLFSSSFPNFRSHQITQ